jgi:IPT/TIG domain
MKLRLSIIVAFLITLWVHDVCSACFLNSRANGLERPIRPRLVDASESASLTPKTGLEIAQGSSAPTINSLSPPVGPIGTLVTIRGSHFTAINFIKFQGARAVFNAGSPVTSEDGDTLQFRVSPCSSSQPQCPTFYVSPGEYLVVVTNENGTSNERRFVITPL